jgi:hypothetical protein
MSIVATQDRMWYHVPTSDIRFLWTGLAARYYQEA